MAPSDSFGLGALDDQVKVVVPAGPLTNKVAVGQAISALQPGGLTNLSAGLLRGLQEARRVSGESGATLLLLSDGHANRGVTSHDALADVAGTIGYELLTALGARYTRRYQERPA